MLTTRAFFVTAQERRSKYERGVARSMQRRDGDARRRRRPLRSTHRRGRRVRRRGESADSKRRLKEEKYVREPVWSSLPKKTSTASARSVRKSWRTEVSRRIATRRRRTRAFVFAANPVAPVRAQKGLRARRQGKDGWVRGRTHRRQDERHQESQVQLEKIHHGVIRNLIRIQSNLFLRFARSRARGCRFQL